MNEIKFVISRHYAEKETLGWACVFDGRDKVFEFNTIELPMFVVPLMTNTPCTNCIPEGTYRVTKIYSPTKGACFQVHNVPGRTAILIHRGNYAASTGNKKIDTEGCILVGNGFEDVNKDGELDVINSTATLTHLLSILPSEFKIIIF